MTTFAPPLRSSALILAAFMCSAAARGQAPPAPVFDPPLTFMTIDNPFDLAAADIDLDGNVDLAVGSADGNTVWVYLNRGPDYWTTSPTKALKLVGIYDSPCPVGTTPDEIPNLTFGNFEFPGYPRDAYPDLALKLRKATSLWYLRKKGAGAATPFEHGACVGVTALAARDIVAVDFDGDSYDDVAIACRSGGNPQLAIVWNNPAPDPANIFLPAYVTVPFSGHAYELDLVHAGGVGSSPTTPRDLVMTDPSPNPESSWVYVFKHGTGETVDFHARRDSVPSRGITAAPFNLGDSHWDLATTEYLSTNNDLRWLEASGTGGFTLDQFEYPLPTNASSHGADSGKINNDDWIDVVVANEGAAGFEGNVSVFINNNGVESTLFGSRYDFAVIRPDPGPTPHDAGPVQVLLADLNGDGYLDIITTNSRDDTISVLINSL